MRTAFNMIVAAVALVIVSAPCMVSAQTDGTLCNQAIASDPQFADLAKKLPLSDLRGVTLTMLSDDAYPTDQERAELTEWFARHEACETAAEPERRQTYSPKVFALLSEMDDRLTIIGADLYGRHITFGEALKQLIAAKNDIAEKVAAEVTEERTAASAANDAAERDAKAEQQAQMAQEAANRRQRALLLMGLLNANRPTPVQPYVMPTAPAGANCTTSYVGSQAYTHCQ